MFPRFPDWCARLALLILTLALLSACSADQISTVLGLNTTPTPDPTLMAVPSMLTQTAEALEAARLATRTPTPTFTPTPIPSVPIPETGSREAPVKPGQRIQTGAYALIVLPPKQVATVGTHKAAAGRAILDVPVVLQNTGQQSAPYASLYFHLVDTAKPQDELQPAPFNAPGSPALLSGDLTPGDVVRGHLFFDIPESGGNYQLSFDPQGTGRSTLWADLSQPGAADTLPSPEAAGSLPGLGKRVEHSGEALTLQSVTARQTYGRIKPGAGNLFVELSVVIENASLTSVSYNADYFRIKDSLGYEYPSIIIPNETLLMAGSLAQGRQVSGHVIFEIPAAAQALVLSYQPLVIGQTFEPIKIQVELPASR